jgi:hypothetical protein
MCRSIIPFDVTDIGPLFVASFKNANMINYASLSDLAMERSEKTSANAFCSEDYGKGLQRISIARSRLWKKIMASEATPGLPTKDRDKSFPPRTRVVGVIDKIAQPQVVYLEELMKCGLVKNEDLDIFFVAVNNTVNGFKSNLNGRSLNITLNFDNTLCDRSSGTVWDIRGKRIRGEIELNLEPVALSDEYWFSWKRFHPTSKLIRVRTNPDYCNP